MKYFNGSRFLDIRNQLIQSLQEGLSVLENLYIDIYKDTIINKQMSVTKHSSNRDYTSTLKRRASNEGMNNPNNKYHEDLIANVLYLKLRGHKPIQIPEMLLKNENIEITNKGYISQIGISKWVNLEPIKPERYSA
jgi:hypothetical protein